MVGFGAAGGDEGVAGGVDLGGDGAGDEGFEFGGGGCLVPGVHGGVECGRGEVGGGCEGEWGAVQVGCAVGVCGVCGALGEGVYEGVEGFFGAGSGVGQYGVGGGSYACGDGLWSAGGEGAGAVGCALVERVEDGADEGPQGARACGPSGEGRRAHAGVLRCAWGCGPGLGGVPACSGAGLYGEQVACPLSTTMSTRKWYCLRRRGCWAVSGCYGGCSVLCAGGSVLVLCAGFSFRGCPGRVAGRRVGR